MPGKYVLYKDHHFLGMEIWQDGTYIVRPTCRTDVGSIRNWTPDELHGFMIFSMRPVGCQQMSNCGDARGGTAVRGAVTEVTGAVTFRSPLTGNTLVECNSAALLGNCFADLPFEQQGSSSFVTFSKPISV